MLNNFQCIQGILNIMRLYFIYILISKPLLTWHRAKVGAALLLWNSAEVLDPHSTSFGEWCFLILLLYGLRWREGKYHLGTCYRWMVVKVPVSYLVSYGTSLVRKERGTLLPLSRKKKSYIPTGPSRIPSMQRYTSLWGFGLFVFYCTLPSKILLHKYMLN